MNSNEKGTLAEAHVLYDLTKKGIRVFKPFDDHSPIDFVIADRDYNLFRLQVKMVSFNKNNNLKLPLDSVINGKKIRINIETIDFWAMYNLTLDKVFYIKKTDFKSKNFYLHKYKDNKLGHPSIEDAELSNPLRLFGMDSKPVGVTGTLC